MNIIVEYLDMIFHAVIAPVREAIPGDVCTRAIASPKWRRDILVSLHVPVQHGRSDTSAICHQRIIPQEVIHPAIRDASLCGKARKILVKKPRAVADAMKSLFLPPVGEVLPKAERVAALHLMDEPFRRMAAAPIPDRPMQAVKRRTTEERRVRG